MILKFPNFVLLMQCSDAFNSYFLVAVPVNYVLFEMCLSVCKTCIPNEHSIFNFPHERNYCWSIIDYDLIRTSTLLHEHNMTTVVIIKRPSVLQNVTFWIVSAVCKTANLWMQDSIPFRISLFWWLWMQNTSIQKYLA